MIGEGLSKLATSVFTSIGERNDVTPRDPPVPANVVERKGAAIKKPIQVGTRDSKESCGLVRRHSGFVGSGENLMAFAKVAQHCAEALGERRRRVSVDRGLQIVKEIAVGWVGS